MVDANLIFWPVVCHLILLVALYTWLSVARFQARAGRDVAALEARISRNLANQFEWPTLFYAIVVLIFLTNEVTSLQLILAWVFIGGRVFHTLIHTLTPQVILRGGVFMINFIAVILMWCVFLWPRLVG